MGILDDYLTELELATELGVEASTLQRWRRLGIGPRWAYKGKTPLANREAWKGWLRDGGFKQHRSRPARKSLARHSIAAVQGSP
jgi:hypothetical protein